MSDSSLIFPLAFQYFASLYVNHARKKPVAFVHNKVKTSSVAPDINITANIDSSASTSQRQFINGKYMFFISRPPFVKLFYSVYYYSCRLSKVLSLLSRQTPFCCNDEYHNTHCCYICPPP